MDQEIRNKLRNVVTQCRKLLEDSVSQELEGKYGIFAKKDQVTADPNAKMGHLTEEDQAARKDILDHLGHIKARGFKPKDALDQLIREIAFTHLNRLCAYKMMEAREVYVGGQKFREAVSRGINSNGVKFFLAEHPEEERLFNTGHQDVVYRHFLDWLGGALSDEIGVLFNPNDPANRLYPRQKTLDDVLDLLNGGGIKAEETELREQWPQIWSQDETIGWVYQYFTPKELRDQARKESQAPRNSYELAFRNQFFTPRYVVEFLTDNTLGRIWYEMLKGDTTLKDQCRYMVRRTTEIFLKEGQQTPKDAAEGRDDLSQEELLKLPVHIPHRPKKDPRELKILDPACGSGHFLLYCFDLLLTIYEEAYADPDLGPALKKDYPTLDALKRDVPRLILAHNLHGIDIDLRASQIAALALWLRCQRAYQEMGLKKDRPKITRSNFVCAEPMPGEEKMLKEFVSQLEPKVLGQVVEVVFDKMKLAGEAGSLLKIEEEIRDAVAAAKKQYLRESTQATDKKGRALLFSEAEMDRISEKPTQLSLFDVSDITDDQFFEQAEARVISTLRSFAENAQQGQRLQRRLFTDDSVRGFAFVDLCQKRYDVVLMNPPFGLPTESAFRYLEAVSLPTYVEIYASFVERALKGLAEGYVGAITSRSFTTMSRLTEWRRESIIGRLSLILDLGLGVMDDAAVESCAYVLRTTSNEQPVLILDLRSARHRETQSLATNWLHSDRGTNTALFSVFPNRFFANNQHRLLYRIDSALHDIVTSSDSFEPSGGIVRTGLTTFDDFRFLRLRWEVPLSMIGQGIYWEPFSKGGERVKYHSDVHLLVNRRNDGEELAEANIRCNGQVAQSRQGSTYYYKAGLTFTSRCSSFSVRALPEGCVISHNAPSLYANSDDETLYVMGWINSRLIRALVETQANKEYYVPGSVKSLPWRAAPTRDREVIREATVTLYRSYKRLTECNETTAHFRGREWKISLLATFEESERRRCHVISLIKEHQHSVSEAVDRVYGTDSKSFAIDVIGDDPDDEVLAESVTLRGITDEFISFAVGCLFGRWKIFPVTEQSTESPMEQLPLCPPRMRKPTGEDRPSQLADLSDGYSSIVHWDGIVSDDADRLDGMAQQVLQVFEIVWPDEFDSVEKEASEILGVKELREYFRKPGKGGFWDDHISRYSKSRRKAPIYWLLQSSKKNYAIWLYYHRLDKDLLFKALVNYVEPKIRLETSRIDSLRSQKAAAGENGKDAKRLAKDLEKQEDFLSELRDFEDKLRRAANLHLEPDLNDGVVLNIAPLWELVPWKEAKKYWDELLEGQYEWSSIGKQLREKGLVK
jgi:hypothetical protein